MRWYRGFPITRYTEISFINAEAKNDLSGPDSSLCDAIDDVRDRVGMAAVYQAMYDTKEKMCELIRNERRIELVGERQC